MAERLRHPPLLKVLFLTEMWERFSFYLMIGILYQYLTDSQKGGLGWTGAEASVVVGSYQALVYFTPFIGGLLADRLLGSRKTIIIGGILMMIGHAVLAVPNLFGLYAGLGFLILGNGAFKPNISTLVGNLYSAGHPLKDAGYNIFYMGINVGAFICNFVAAYVRNFFDNHPEYGIGGWHAAFATAGVGMFLGLVIFIANYRRFSDVDPDPRLATGPKESLKPLWLYCLLPAFILGGLSWIVVEPAIIEWFSLNLLRLEQPLYAPPFNGPTAAFLGACIPVIVFYLRIWRSVPNPVERGRVSALLVIYGVVIVFWMTFHLNTTALTDWAADDTNRVPNALVGQLTDRMEEFAETAPPKYFKNAAPDVKRPAKETYEIVSDDRYQELVKSKQISVIEGQKVYVTQKMFDEVYQHASNETPTLPTGTHLKLVNTELFQSINAGMVVMLTPLFVALWHYLRTRQKEPSTQAKIGLGLLLTAGAPAVMLGATLISNDGEFKVSPWWLFGTYFMGTLGELCLSPMGLSLVSKMSPNNIKAFMMGGWFLATSFGNKLSGIFGEVYHNMDHEQFWMILIGCCLGVSLVIFALLPWLKRQMGEGK